MSAASRWQLGEEERTRRWRAAVALQASQKEAHLTKDIESKSASLQYLGAQLQRARTELKQAQECPVFAEGERVHH